MTMPGRADRSARGKVEIAVAVNIADVSAGGSLRGWRGGLGCGGLDGTQEQLPARLGTTRMTITRYEAGTRRISGVAQTALKQLASSSHIPMAGIVAAGTPIEPILQTEHIDVPPSMARNGENFAL